jgi:PQQ-dependent dehydrogenase (methanol/ethanol family)
MRPVVGIPIVALLVLGVAGAAAGHPSKSQTAAAIPAFSVAQLKALPGDDWIVQSGNLYGQRNSTLKTITPANIGTAVEAWHVKLASSHAEPLLQLPGEAPQLEYKGTVYGEDQYGRVFALNATTGAQLWVFEPNSHKLDIPSRIQSKLFKVAGPWASTRGLALGDGMVFAEEQLGKVVALDAATGKQKWAKTIDSPTSGIGLSQPPTYVNGMIIGSTSGGDTGYLCVVFALNAKTGKLLWKTPVIPQNANDPAWKTWAHPIPWNGGGAIWAQNSVDPQAGIVYASIGNPIPYSGLQRGPGLEHYTGGQLALDMKTGKVKWFYQEVHHDIWDADQSQQGMLFDMKYNGKMRKAMMTANKDGLWYVIDRITGKPIIPVKEVPVQQSKEAHTYATQPIPETTPLVPQNVPDRAKWKGLTAPDGKPYNIGHGGPAGSFTALDSKSYSVTAAFGQGASGNKPASIDPATGYLIEETTPGFSAFKAIPASEVKARKGPFAFGAVLDYNIASLKGTPAAAVAGTRLEAMDLRTGKAVWVVDRKTPTNAAAAKVSSPFGGGVLTAGGIIWTNGGKHLQAFDEKTGKLLWSSPVLAGASTSPPTTYQVGGTQYVTTLVASTGDLYAFSVTGGYVKPA